MSNDLKCLPINFYLLTMFDVCLNRLFRVALKAISWASGVELNYIRRGNVFLLRLQKFFLFCNIVFIFTFFYVFNVFLFLFERFLHLWHRFCSVWQPIHLTDYSCLTASFPGQPGQAGTRKVKPIWIQMRQEIQWHQLDNMQTICTSPRQITTPTPNHTIFTGRMLFLASNQRLQSTEDIYT